MWMLPGRVLQLVSVRWCDGSCWILAKVRGAALEKGSWERSVARCVWLSDGARCSNLCSSYSSSSSLSDWTWMWFSTPYAIRVLSNVPFFSYRRYACPFPLFMRCECFSFFPSISIPWHVPLPPVFFSCAGHTSFRNTFPFLFHAFSFFFPFLQCHTLVHSHAPLFVNALSMIYLFATHALASSHAPFLYSCGVAALFFLLLPTPSHVPMSPFSFMGCAYTLFFRR